MGFDYALNVINDLIVPCIIVQLILGKNSSRVTCQAQQDIKLLFGESKLLAFEKYLSGYGINDQIISAYKRIAKFFGRVYAFSLIKECACAKHSSVV